MQTKPLRTRRKRCKSCQQLFEPDPRTKGKQQYCSKTECQTQRQRQNEKDWRERNPDCLAYQQEQSRQWHKDRPDYSCQRRSNDPELLVHNRDQTRIRMRKIRGKRMFDKSKVILTELTGGKEDNCYLTQGGKGLYVRLTKASPLSRAGSLRDNRQRFKRVPNRLPKGRLYDLSAILDSS
jgi:hypothetical protein